ncbi:hypothetical protein Pmani_000766 [Petrolisthes manimaculis]|uniref:Uncharacterized protein n=1 Tax=Petrolisthes manimaculis TaxID=1843537 RepID=A0AAE1USC3_9EUCA|nr:hypothetical protein Pmani_000766 [Petrolisthes manimaculis]
MSVTPPSHHLISGRPPLPRPHITHAFTSLSIIPRTSLRTHARYSPHHAHASLLTTPRPRLATPPRPRSLPSTPRPLLATHYTTSTPRYSLHHSRYPLHHAHYPLHHARSICEP